MWLLIAFLVFPPLEPANQTVGAYSTKQECQADLDRNMKLLDKKVEQKEVLGAALACVEMNRVR